MSETKTPIKTLNGHALADWEAREAAAANAEEIGKLSEDKVNKQQGAENAEKLLFVGDDGELIHAELGKGIKVEKVPGKNIFHGEWVAGSYNAEGVYAPNATFTGNFAVNEYFPVEPSTTYMFSNTEAAKMGAAGYITEYDEDKTFVARHNGVIQTAQVFQKSFTTSANTKYITIFCYAYDGRNAIIADAAPVNFMIEKGTEATTYEPYEVSQTKISVGNDIPVPNSGKGICKIGLTGKNIFHGNWETGSWNSDTGEWTESVYTGSISVHKKFPVIPGKDYTFSHGKLFSFYATMYLYEYDENDIYLGITKYVLTFDTEFSATVRLKERTRYIAFHIYQEGGSEWRNAIPTDFMIEHGSVATQYEPYTITDALGLNPQTAYDEFAYAGLMPERFTVPAYCHENNYIDSKCARIRELAESCAGNGDVFMFSTDQHWEINARNSPALMKYIAEHENIPRLFCGGDTVSNSGSALEEFVDTINTAYDGTIHFVMGNHEYFEDRGGNKLAYIFDMGKSEQVGNTKRHYYYVDNKQQKIRYVVLCAFSADSGALGTSYDTEQVEWLRDTALDVESGWTVIVFAHSLYTEYKTPSPEGADAVIETLDNAACDVACVITGHFHRDFTHTTPGGIPVVVTTCDKYDPWISEGTNMEPWLSNRVKGTITEQAFDVVVLDKEQRKLTFVRIGAPAENWAGGTSDGTTMEERVVTY